MRKSESEQDTKASATSVRRGNLDGDMHHAADLRYEWPNTLHSQHTLYSGLR